MYLIFGGDDYYPFGGFHDYIGTATTIDDALAAVRDTVEYEWWHVVDVATMAIVVSNKDNIMLGYV